MQNRKTLERTDTQPDNYYSFERSDMLMFLPDSFNRVLEIGCAEGGFRQLIKHDVEYWGIELNPEIGKIASQSLDKVLIGDYFEVYSKLPNDYFDLIICNDIIEHLPDEQRFFRTIKLKMAGHASLVASVPNVRFVKNLFELLIQKDWRYKDAGILDRTHLRFFTQKSLTRAIQESGFNIVSLRGVNKVYRLDYARGSTNLLKRLAQQVVALVSGAILGKDTLYLQYAFRATVAKE